MQGYYRAIGIVTHPNPGSEALHRAMGFVPVARWEKAGYKLGKWHDVQWFQKQIAPARHTPAASSGYTAGCGTGAGAV